MSLTASGAAIPPRRKVFPLGYEIREYWANYHDITVSENGVIIAEFGYGDRLNPDWAVDPRVLRIHRPPSLLAKKLNEYFDCMAALSLSVDDMFNALAGFLENELLTDDSMTRKHK